MGSIGMNVDRSGRHDPALIRSLGCTWQRIVAMPDLDLSVHFRNCKQAGVQTLLVLARESFSGFGPVRESDGYPAEKTARAAVRHYRTLYGALVTAGQVGNESDLVSGSSWTLPQADLVQLGRWVREEWPRPFALVCAGMASGHPEYLDGADLSWCDATAVQPYAKDGPSPDDIEDLPDVDALVREYQRFGLPVLVTEWGWWADQEPRASEETRDMVRWAAQTSDCEVFFWFCADDAMVPPFGLLDAGGRPKPRAAVFKAEAAKAVHSLWPSVVEQPQPEPEPSGPDPWRWWDAPTIAATIRCSEARVREHWPRLAEQLNHCRLYEMPVAAAMLGTVAVETAHRFEPIHEFRNADGSIPPIWYTYDGGPEFHGRGFIQLTHRGNYATYGPKVAELWGAGGWEPDFDLVGDPDRALNPDISAAVSALYFRDHGREDGVGIPEAARAGNWREVRRLVQGGSSGLGDFTRYASSLVAQARPDVPTEPDVPPTPDTGAELIAAYETALRTLRDETLPAVRTALESTELALDEAQRQLDECRRIVKQFAPP